MSKTDWILNPQITHNLDILKEKSRARDYLTTQGNDIIATKTNHAVSHTLDKESSHFDKVHYKL